MKNQEMKKVSKEWLKKAKEDFITAETLLNSSEERLQFLTASIGFHSQQCIEKCLKALLILKQKDFKRSHDIYYLLNLCEEEIDLDGLDKIRKKADMLNDFAVNARYPGDYTDFNIDESKLAFQITKKVFSMTGNILNYNC